jgi:ribosomal-protein-alanine N-acetyltransferase
MNSVIELETNRLKLRQWKASDLPAFSQMNADTEVMRYFPHVLSEHESNILANKLKKLIAEQTWGLWAVEIKLTKTFIGFVGLHKSSIDLSVSPCIEIAWRLSQKYWGKGYATEAAFEVLSTAFIRLKINEIYSFTSSVNVRSQSVMTRLNMVNTGNNFDHPNIIKNHPLREHVLYKLNAEQWRLSTK